jgi:hypothetical protein
MQTSNRRTLALLAAVATISLPALSACGGDDGQDAPGPAPAVSSATAAELTVKDPWVKAADKGMTAAFGTLVNNTDHEVTVVAVSSPASKMELHEMAMQDGKMVMRPKEGGFAIAAGGTHELAPGGDHLMLMAPTAPIKPGDELQFSLSLSDGQTVAFSAIAKPFAGAGESYAPSMAPSMGSMSK